MSISSEYYILRQSRLLMEFRRYVKYTRRVLLGYFGEEKVDALVAGTQMEFKALIPQLPYIGGKQPFTQFIIFTGILLAIYRVNKQQGLSVEETGKMVFEIGREFLRNYPAILRRIFGSMNFSRFYLNRLRRRAIESHQRKYSDDYVFNFVQGDGSAFDYGVDYLECASCKFLAKQGAPELAPYLCPVNILYSEALGWGLVRTQTLAEGASRCDFRFKKGGPTNVAVPIAMRQVVEQSG